MRKSEIIAITSLYVCCSLTVFANQPSDKELVGRMIKTMSTLPTQAGSPPGENGPCPIETVSITQDLGATDSHILLTRYDQCSANDQANTAVKVTDPRRSQAQFLDVKVCDNFLMPTISLRKSNERVGEKNASIISFLAEVELLDSSGRPTGQKEKRVLQKYINERGRVELKIVHQDCVNGEDLMQIAPNRPPLCLVSGKSVATSKNAAFKDVKAGDQIVLKDINENVTGHDGKFQAFNRVQVTSTGTKEGLQFVMNFNDIAEQMAQSPAENTPHINMLNYTDSMVSSTRYQSAEQSSSPERVSYQQHSDIQVSSLNTRPYPGSQPAPRFFQNPAVQQHKKKGFFGKLFSGIGEAAKSVTGFLGGFFSKKEKRPHYNTAKVDLRTTLAPAPAPAPRISTTRSTSPIANSTTRTTRELSVPRAKLLGLPKDYYRGHANEGDGCRLNSGAKNQLQRLFSTVPDNPQGQCIGTPNGRRAQATLIQYDKDGEVLDKVTRGPTTSKREIASITKVLTAYAIYLRRIEKQKLRNPRLDSLQQEALTPRSYKLSNGKKAYNYSDYNAANVVLANELFGSHDNALKEMRTLINHILGISPEQAKTRYSLTTVTGLKASDRSFSPGSSRKNNRFEIDLRPANRTKKGNQFTSEDYAEIMAKIYLNKGFRDYMQNNARFSLDRHTKVGVTNCAGYTTTTTIDISPRGCKHSKYQLVVYSNHSKNITNQVREVLQNNVREVQ